MSYMKTCGGIYCHKNIPLIGHCNDNINRTDTATTLCSKCKLICSVLKTVSVMDKRICRKPMNDLIPLTMLQEQTKLGALQSYKDLHQVLKMLNVKEETWYNYVDRNSRKSPPSYSSTLSSIANTFAITLNSSHGAPDTSPSPLECQDILKCARLICSCKKVVQGDSQTV